MASDEGEAREPFRPAGRERALAPDALLDLRVEDDPAVLGNPPLSQHCHRTVTALAYQEQAMDGRNFILNRIGTGRPAQTAAADIRDGSGSNNTSIDTTLRTRLASRTRIATTGGEADWPVGGVLDVSGTSHMCPERSVPRISPVTTTVTTSGLSAHCQRTVIVAGQPCWRGSGSGICSGAGGSGCMGRREPRFGTGVMFGGGCDAVVLCQGGLSEGLSVQVGC